MNRISRITVAIAAALAVIPLAACDTPSIPRPPEPSATPTARADNPEDLKAQAEAEKAALAAASAGLSGVEPGGPSVVNADARLQFMTSSDISVQYEALTFTQTSSQSGLLTIPANAKAVQEGVKIPVTDIPHLYNDGQMLPEADLNGTKVIIRTMSISQDALVLDLLTDKSPKENLKERGVLVLKAPKELRNLCEEAPGVDCSARNLFGRDWTNKVLNGIIVANANATNMNAPGAQLRNSRWDGAQMFRGNFTGADVTGASLKAIKGQNLMMNSEADKGAKTKASNTNFTGSFMYRCQFDGADLGNSIWDKVDGQNCTFDGAYMGAFRAAGAWLNRAKMSKVDMNSSIAPDVKLSQATMNEADLSYSTLTGGLLDRVEAKKANFKKVNLTGANCTMAQSYLDGSDMTGMSAAGCSFPRASMKDVNAPWFNAPGADLTYTDLKGANFESANFAGTNFFNADTTGVKMSNATLIGAICPNGDIVGQTSYTKWRQLNISGAGVNDPYLVTDCFWDDPAYSIAGGVVFEKKSMYSGILKEYRRY